MNNQKDHKDTPYQYFLITSYPFEGDGVDTYDKPDIAALAYEQSLPNLNSGYISDLRLIKGKVIRHHTRFADSGEVKDLLE